MTRDLQVGDASLLERIAAEPALVQLILLLVLGLSAWAIVARLSRRARDARGRAAIRDHLLGVELLLLGDSTGAHRRLARAVSADPEDAAVRLAHALALGSLGRFSEAHRAHVELRTALDERSFPNELGMATALLNADRSEDALEPAQRASRLRPDDPSALEAMVRAADGGGWPELAGKAALDRFRLASTPEARELWSGRAIELGNSAVRAALRDGRTADARELVASLRSAIGDTPGVHRLQFLAEPPVRAIAPADPAALLALSLAECGPAGLIGELGSAARAADAIEANDAHVELLCDRWIADEDEAGEELVELGVRAVEPVFRRAVEQPVGDARFAGLLHRIGVDALPAVFESFTAASSRHGLSRGPRRTRHARALQLVLKGFGAEALAVIEPRFETADRALRKVLIDWFVALGDPEVFARVAEVCAPVELLLRLNESDSSGLIRLLRNLPEGHVVLDVLLAEPSFERDEELLAAIPGAAAPRVLESLVARRGPTRAALRALVAHADDADLREVVNRIVTGFGRRALPQLVAAYADVDRPGALRDALATHLDRAGPAVVPLLCDCFGSAPAGLDADLVDRLCAVGEAAVDPLLDGYRRGGLVERLAGALARRRTHRRERILQAIGRIGGRRARLALTELMREETDADLKLRLAQRLHALDAQAPASPDRKQPPQKEDHGQVG